MNKPLRFHGTALRGLAALLATALASPGFAQDEPKTSPAATAKAATVASQGEEAEMMRQMMELATLNENHKLLASLEGAWNYNVTFWMDPSGSPQESKGTALRRPIMGGRYFILDVTGKMQMPGADGKMKDFDFKGMSLEGYDNVKKKFVGTWCDNLSTGVMMSEGTYDPSSKTFTYTGEYEPMPGLRTKIRETVKIADNDHHLFEWFEDRGGAEAKTMEISYTRKK